MAMNDEDASSGLTLTELETQTQFRGALDKQPDPTLVEKLTTPIRNPLDNYVFFVENPTSSKLKQT